MAKRLSMGERFWVGVNKNGPIHPEYGPCWEWIKSVKGPGYGQITKRGKCYSAHRVSYEIIIGPIPEGKDVLHKCDNKRCVNPDHLFLGTAKDNIDDCINKGLFHPARGENSGRSKLTEREVLLIRHLRESQGTTLNELGKKFGVCCATIRAVIDRKSWTHI